MTNRRRGFTLLEMLIVIAIIMIIAALVFMGTNEIRASSYRITCQGNLRALMQGWLLYSKDNSDLLISADNKVGGWVMSGNSIRALETGLLYPYVPSPDTYKCPADPLTYADPYGKTFYTPDQANRSYCIVNQMNGEKHTTGGVPDPMFTRFSQIDKPSLYLVWLEEFDPRTYNMNSFMIIPRGDTWIDFPAFWHSTGMCIAYADGHTDYLHFVDQYKDPTTGDTFCRTTRLKWFGKTTPNNPDLKKLQSMVAPNVEQF